MRLRAAGLEDGPNQLFRDAGLRRRSFEIIEGVAPERHGGVVVREITPAVFAALQVTFECLSDLER